MKIIRHTARDMRQAMRAVREQLGDDAVILSSRRTSSGVEVTAAVDFDASTLEAGGFAGTPSTDVALIPGSSTARSASTGRTNAARRAETQMPSQDTGVPARVDAAPQFIGLVDRAPAYETEWISPAAREAVVSFTEASRESGKAARSDGKSARADAKAARAEAKASRADAKTARADAKAARPDAIETAVEADDAPAVAAATRSELSPARPAAGGPAAVGPATGAPAARAPSYAEMAAAVAADAAAVAAAPTLSPARSRTEVPVFRDDTAIEQAQADSLTPFGPTDDIPAASEFHTPPAAVSPAVADVMGNELKTLRRMLETQLAQLAWNDLTRRAPIRSEILRELTEIGITQDLAEHLVRQLPEDTDLTFGRRFTIAGLSQYLRVTGDRWLDDGGRVAFAGATGVGKTTTLAKVAVRWVLRHGPRDIALVAGDAVRIGAQDQLRSLAQLLGVPVHAPDRFENLPDLVGRLSERLVLIDTPGSSVRDGQLGSRLAVLANSASKLETALVLAASTQAGAIEAAVQHFAPANPSCCVLTKLDEAASLGGVLSILIRAKLPVSYASEGQRVPEDLRPARALELVSTAVRLAKARGAAADEDLLRRRFGKIAHGIT
ncbi:MAG TPA: flagellar biosynthesis protein FlhF [Steroidobacteraceae bacterium]|nr:flagellar biosynthesis protein FlhF [Steroidobacteraceae bacterium]